MHMGRVSRFGVGGLTLVEVMVAIGLIAVSLMLVLSLIPVGIHSAHHADQIQAATAWTRGLIETAPIPKEFPILPELASETIETTISGTPYQAVRKISTIPDKYYVYQIEVETTWPEANRPIKLTLVKFSPEGPAP